MDTSYIESWKQEDMGYFVITPPYIPGLAPYTFWHILMELPPNPI